MLGTCLIPINVLAPTETTIQRLRNERRDEELSIKMCSQVVCHLTPEGFSSACKYKDASGKITNVPWVPIEFHTVQYVSSYNVMPRETVVCILPGSHFNIKAERILCPMKWGIIPPWSKDPKKRCLTSHHGAFEKLTTSRLLRGPLMEGRRCAVVVNGFYEWKPSTIRNAKHPFYIYKNTPDGDDEQVLYLAGLFNKWTSEDDDSLSIYSCTIITKPANEALSFIQNRAPVVLETDKDLENWLNVVDVSPEKANAKLMMADLSKNAVLWHSVTSAIGHFMNKEKSCTDREDPPTMQEELMLAWTFQNRQNPKKLKMIPED